jgi:cytochrome c nitrite reductase small subunit
MTRPNAVKFVLVPVVIGLAIAAFVTFGPPKLLAKSETPEFCATCHVMEPQYEAWLHEGAHRRIRCVDCHLPHDNLATYYTWKSIDGMRDVVEFYSGLIPATIRISEHGKQVLQGNCVRCHATAVDRIDSTRQCWGCHRRLQHMLSGTRVGAGGM